MEADENPRMTLDDLHPFVRNAVLANWNWVNEEMTLAYDCRIFLIVSGEAVLRTKTGEYRLTKDAAAFFNAAEPYHFSNAEPDERFGYICVNLDLTSRHTDRVRYIQPAKESQFDPSLLVERVEVDGLPSTLITDCDSSLAQKVRLIYDEIRANRPGRRAKLSALALDYLVSAHRASQQGNSRRAETAAAARAYIEKHCLEPLPNEVIARALGYHPYYLARVFRESCGLSMHQYLLDCRLEAALHRLTSSALSVEQIAFECCFSSSAHFSTAFRAKFGAAPSAFRRDGMQV